MTVLVTGGCGFIGANLVPMLIEAGHEVRIIDNMSRGKKEYLADYDIDIRDVDLRDPDLVEALDGVEQVIHLAAYGSVVESVEDPRTNFDINVFGTFNLLNACRDVGVEQIVFASTGGALIGNAEPPVNETSPPRPISPYGASKLCCEGYLSAFASSYGISATALRFANVIGPYSGHKKGAVTAFMKAVNKNEPIHIYGDGSATRDFLYVGDLCNGIVKTLEAKLDGYNVMHLACGVEVSVKELAELIIDVSGKHDHEIVYHPKRIGEVERNFADYSYARQTIGFVPKVGIKDGLEATWDWFMKNGFS